MSSKVNRILVVDTETTGTDEDKDRPVEIATVMVSRSRSGGTRWQVSDLWTTLVNPEGQPISFGAMGTHHITEEMVDYAPLLDAAVPKKHPLRDAAVVRAAHVSKFDRAHVERVFPVSRWICTYKCARTLWRGLESYSNQALRYARAVRLEPYNLNHLQAHRALYDAVTTAELLVQMLTEAEPATLIKISSEPILLEQIAFGEHAGRKWEDVPTDYLKWMISKGPQRPDPRTGRKTGFSEDVLHTAEHYLRLRGL